MSATPTLNPAENPKLIATLTPMVEFLSKGIGAAAIALYVSGFLIVSLHYSKYGFVATNPFRPRIVAAGAWFFLFTGVPIFIATRLVPNERTWTQIAMLSYPYYIACQVLGFAASQLFTLTPFPTGAGGQWWGILIVVLFVAAFGFLINWKKYPRVSAAASLLFVIINVVFSTRALFVEHVFMQSAIILWFFGVGIVALVEMKVRSQIGDWEKTIILTLATLLLFAVFYYPHLKASWGGGTPVSVTLFFTKDSPIKPNETVSAQLLDESDEGFYIIGSTENKAIYVPRSSVSLVYFSDSLSDSQLLRNKK